MKIANARVAVSARAAARRNLAICGGRIRVTDGGSERDAVDLSGYLLLPGLINAHDHLEFNLFPRLGRRIYSNAGEWAADIYHPDASPLREHLSISKRTRLIWGGLRNLLSGVTTVAHHNPFDERIFDDAFPVHVVRRLGWAHSLGFSPNAAALYADSAPDLPFIIHAGEGTDDRARAEISALDHLGMLGSRTVIVHGLALDRAGFELVKRRGASLVWCPSSNLLTYGCTLRADRLAEIPVALGADSAISAAGDMIDELRIAHDRCGAAPESLYRMVTDQAASILRINSGAGAICDGGIADFIAVEDHGQTPAEAIIDLAPELVVIGGRVRLISPRLLPRFDCGMAEGLQTISLEGRGTSLAPFDIAGLLEEACAALGDGVWLAGKRVCQ